MKHILAQPGDVVDVRPFGAALADASTSMLVQSDRLQIARIVLRAGKEMATHTAPGPIVVHCLEGRIVFTCGGKTNELKAGQLFFLPMKAPHSLKASEDSALLLTILPCETNSSQVDESSQESFPASDSPAWTGAALS